MKCVRFDLGGVPAALWGAQSQDIYLYVHGKFGCKEEAEGFALIAEERGYQTLSVDLPGHGERAKEEDTFYPWNAVPELRRALEYARARWRRVKLYAGSIGAWFSMLAFGDAPPDGCLFVSPILDMERLILDMMRSAGVTEDRLIREQTINTGAGDTLSMRYLNYARARAISRWQTPTAILYGENDHLTSIDTLNEFCARFGCARTVIPGGEHWFHTPEQLTALSRWTRDMV